MSTTFESDWENTRLKERIEELEREVERLNKIKSRTRQAELKAENDALKAERDELKAERDELKAAAQAVIDRWDTPLWKDVPATAQYINRLRTAIAKGEKNV